LDEGTTWTNVAVLNPTLAGPGVQVPESVGVTTVAPTDFPPGAGWVPGATLLLRWVDDNATATSPDQIVGLDNVTLEVVGVVGDPPTVSLTSPLVADVFVAPAVIALGADAQDSDGTVTKVEFYNGATKLGESLGEPFAYSWTDVPAGLYGLTARATDNDDNVVVSSVVTVPVNATAGSGTLTRGAYLQQAGPTTMTIRWRSSQYIAGRVRFGPEPGSLTGMSDETGWRTDHEVTLVGLTPETTYFYSIGSADDTLAGGDSAHTFTTPPAAGSTPATRIWVLGDAGTGTVGQANVRDAFYTWTGVRDPDLVLELGDNAYNVGSDSEFQEKLFDVYGSLMTRVPFWSCLGNHETGQGTAFVDTYPYFDIYTFPKNGECGGVVSGSEHYYSFDYGNIHFISLDSMTASRSPTGAMADWLTLDLAATTSTWIVCYFHHPPYTKGSHNSDSLTDSDGSMVEMRQNILPILEAGGVDLVLSGHSHSYERSFLLDGHYGLSGTLTPAMKRDPGDGRPAGDGAYIKPLTGPREHFGAVYAVPGSSGKTSGGSLNHPAHFISLNNLGSLVLDVEGNRLDATFVRENGSLPDTFTLIKQGAADSDGDGIPDEFEIANGLDRFDPADALLDTDGDKLSNLEEFLFGLLPGSADHYEWSTTYNLVTGNVEVSFPTNAGREYRVYWSPDLLDWNPGSDVVDGDGGLKQWVDDGSVTGSQPSVAQARFYRVQVMGR